MFCIQHPQTVTTAVVNDKIVACGLCGGSKKSETLKYLSFLKGTKKNIGECGELCCGKN